MKSRYVIRCNLLSFLTAFTTLALQILIFRIISAKLVNNYAFLVISITMLGFALSGVILAFKKNYLKNFRLNIHRFIYLWVFSLFLSTIIFYYIPVGVQVTASRIVFIRDFLFYISVAIIFVVPFVFSGMILGLLLSHPKLPTRKIYGFDLIGSAAGALAAVYCISLIGVEKSLVILCAFLVIYINIFLPIRKKFFYGAFLLSLLLLFHLFFFGNGIFKMKYPKDSMLAKTGLEYFKWDPIARIEVSDFIKYYPSPESLGCPWDFSWLSYTGSNRNFYSHFRKLLTQNNYAFTLAIYYDGQKDSLKGIEETIYSSAYHASSIFLPNVLTIGVGGGTDVLAALYFNASKITGVEINGAVHKILKGYYRDYFQGWVNNPKVYLVHDEGRHFLARTKEKFDIIQLTGVDSYSGTIASANIFSESYLYTKEAMKLYFDKLTDQGILAIVRPDWTYLPSEVLRMLTTAVFVLRESGVVNPSEHIMTVTARTGMPTALLVKKTPFTEMEVGRVKDWTESHPYVFLSSAKIPQRKNIYHFFLGLNNESLERAFIEQYPLNISPIKDDSPFFFRGTYWKHLKGPKYIIPILEYSLLMLFVCFGFLTLVFIYIPLKMVARLNNSKKFYKYGFVLACTGLGYLFFEIALMQKYGLFLGHPNYAISVVLSSLLLSSGLGSLFSKPIISWIKNARYVSYCCSIIVFFEYVFILPNLYSIIGLHIFIKGIITALLVFPIGLLLGIYMPIAIDRLKRISPQSVPWGWGINGIFSVMAPILAIGISVSWGINVLILSAVPFYLIAGFLLDHKD